MAEQLQISRIGGVHEKKTWQQFNEKAVGFGYRSGLKNKILKKLKKLQITLVSKF